MKKIIYITIGIIFLTSCEKFLDVKPVTEIPSELAVQSTKDLTTLLYGTYDGLQSGNVYGGNFIMFGDLLADDAAVDEGKLSQFGTSEIYNRVTSTQIGYLRYAWSDCYSTINRANLIIYYIDNDLINDEDFEEIKDDYKGQALFIRAITHFQLLNFWSHAYNVDNPEGNTQLGIPYRTTPTLSYLDELDMARNTVEEVYNKIITDLQNSIDLIEATSHSSMASKMAATAFLARVYFFKGDYANAAIEANNVINSSGSYDMADSASIAEIYQLQGDYADDEVIFQLVNTSSDQSNALPGYYQSTKGAIFYSSTELLDSYRTDYDTTLDFWGSPIFSDVRAKLLLTYYSNLNKAFIAKWNQSGSLSNNIPIIRLAEMHLIRAEANYLTNGLQTEALDSYKAVRARSVGEAIYEAEGTPAWTDDDFLVKIRAERRRELAFEGDRYLNLRRLKQNVRDGVAYNDNSLLFKIPQEEMSGNSLMEQNP